MAEAIDFAVLTRMLKTAATAVKGRQEELSTLDAATGDGDHGAAMSKVADAIITTIDGHTAGKLGELLSEIAWAAMGTDAGSTGPLYGSLFLGMSGSVGDTDTLDCAAFVAMLEGGVAQLRQNTKAEIGNKTMIDALVPAVTAARAAVDGDQDIAACLEAAADAAAKGAESTKDMQAAFGRAKNIGERSIGHVDPGATSTSIVFEGLKEGFKNG